MEEILKINDKKEEKFLRRKTVDFDFQKFSRKEIEGLLKKMKEIMLEADGIGLSANQIGFDFRVFVAQMPRFKEDGGAGKFYAVFNPRIIKTSKEKTIAEEGCLSVPEKFGEVSRFSKIVISGFDKNGKKIEIKAWGLLARIFQHEIDHLNGILFIDKAKNLRKYENVRNYEKEENL